MSNFVKKMSIKAIGCDPTEARQKVNADKIIDLCVIYGRAAGVKNGENRQTGDIWSALTGRFEAVNLQTTDESKRNWNSGMVFIPGGIQEAIEGAIAAGGEKTVIEFAMKISAKYDEKSPVGYVYLGSSMKPPAESDELSELRKLASEVPVKQIAAPAPVAEPTPAPAPAPVPAPAPAPARTRNK